MKKLAHFLVQKRITLFTLSVILAIVFACMIPFVTVNKDQSKYLASDSNMREGLDIIMNEFPPVELKDRAVGAMGTDGIIIDLTTDEMTEIYSLALYDVDNNGVGVGSYHGLIPEGVAAMYVNGEVIEVDLSTITKNNSFSALTSITPDGSYAVGWYAANENDAYAAAYLYQSQVLVCTTKVH